MAWLGMRYRSCVLLLVVAVLSACASALVSHGFEFEGFDSPGIRVLDYRYGESRQPSARASPSDVAADTVLQAASVSGEMLRGDDLYVRWRIRATGEVYERTVDLKSRLPRNIEHTTITFDIQGPRLRVYLATWETRPRDVKPIGPKRYLPYRVFLIADELGAVVSGK